ncbi:MFS transporter [Lactobacillus salivarius]|uniref:MFS transporter n=2 Tax=Ligilactobacillus salivarius TaxID=1624 RepID=A0A7X2MEL0_9LACO|nr:MFS transporter [Ligilactobacillus salivarius]
MTSIRKNILYFYIAYVCMVIAIAFPHAVLTILLLKKGLSISQILIVQAAYSCAILISEYPSGVLADLYSKKRLFLVSKICLIAMFLIIIGSKSFIFMVLAWILYGISSALDSGTIDAEIINTLKQNNSANKVPKFISNINRLDFIALIIGGSVGSWLYYTVGIKFYYFSIFLVLLCMILIYRGYNGGSNVNTSKISSTNIAYQVKSGILELKKSSVLRLMVYLTFTSQFFFQTHFQLWQAFFLSRNIHKENFYIYYIVFQVLSILAYSLNFRLNKRNTSIFYAICSVIMIIGILLIQNINNVIFTISYSILVCVFMSFDYFSNVLFSQNVSLENISSLTSLKSSCGRIASLISLLISSTLLHKLNITLVVTLNFGFAIIASIFILFIYLRKIA